MEQKYKIVNKKQAQDWLSTKITPFTVDQKLEQQLDEYDFKHYGGTNLS